MQHSNRIHKIYEKLAVAIIVAWLTNNLSIYLSEITDNYGSRSLYDENIHHKIRYFDVYIKILVAIAKDCI